MATCTKMPSSGAEFTSFCGGNLQSENESCVQFAPLSGSGSAFIIRDTKAPDAGRELRFTGTELDNFVLGYAAQRGLAL